MKQEKLTNLHAPILMTIYFHEGMNQNELAAELQFNKGAVAKIVKTMEAEGYISRISDENDKRIHRLYLTQFGKTVIKKLKDIEKEWSEQIMNGFTDDEIEHLNLLLNRITDNVLLNGTTNNMIGKEENL